MLIKFRCPACNHKIRADSAHAGRHGTCSKCGQPVTVPAATSPGVEEAAAQPDDAAAVLIPADAADARATQAPAPEHAAAPAFITFFCPGCGKRVGFPSHAPGTPATCPACHLAIMIPDKPGGESFIIGNTAPAPAPQQAHTRTPPPMPAAHVAHAANHHTGKTGAQHAVQTPGTHAHKPVAPAAHPVSVRHAGKPSAARRGRLVWALLVGGIAVLVAIIIGGPFLQRYLAGLSKAKTDPPASALKAAPATTETPPANDSPAPPVPAQTKPAATPDKDRDAGAADPLEPVEIRLAPGAVVPASQDIGSLLTLQDRKETRAEVEEDAPPATKKEPAKAPPAKAEGLKAQLNKMAGTKDDSLEPEFPQPAAEPPVIAARPAPKPLACEKCMGTGFVPRQPFVPYVFVEKGTFNPAAAVPWCPCPQCKAGQTETALVQAETDRLKALWEAQRRAPDAAHPSLLYAETHHVALRGQLPESSLRRVGETLEKLAAHLEQTTLSTVLCQTRPGTHQMVIFLDPQGYMTFRSGHTRHDDGEERYRQAFTVVPGLTPPVENMAVFRMARMCMAEATEGKAPAWLMEGFGAFCENAVMRRNLCVPQSMVVSDIRPGDNWDAALKRLAAQNKLPRIEDIWPLSRGNMGPVAYATSYSLVSFLYRDSPRMFARFVLEIRGGAQTADAVQRVYSRTPKELQVLWAQAVGR